MRCRPPEPTTPSDHRAKDPGEPRRSGREFWQLGVKTPRVNVIGIIRVNSSLSLRLAVMTLRDLPPQLSIAHLVDGRPRGRTTFAYADLGMLETAIAACRAAAAKEGT